MQSLRLHDVPFELVPHEVRLLLVDTPDGFPSLRSRDLVAVRLTAFFHTNRHKPDRPQYAGYRGVALQPMTDDRLGLIAAARRGGEHAWRNGYGYTKSGIMLNDLIAADLRPRTLFEAIPRSERGSWARSPRSTSGSGHFAAVPAAQGFKREWRMPAETRLLIWTTRLDEVPIVSAH